MDKKEQRKEQEVAQSWRIQPSLHPAMTLLCFQVQKRRGPAGRAGDGMETEDERWNATLFIGILSLVWALLVFSCGGVLVCDYQKLRWDYQLSLAGRQR